MIVPPSMSGLVVLSFLSRPDGARDISAMSRINRVGAILAMSG